MRTLLLCVVLLASSVRADTPHTFDGKHDISTIDLTVVYLVPSDRTALPDWRERVDYYTNRIAKFHTRESGGTSEMKVHLHPDLLISKKTADELRQGKDADGIFFTSTNEAREALKWPGEKSKAFPIILVLSEINWREMDDFSRTRIIDGKPTHEGNLGNDGRHFPGAESGGARAYYDSSKGHGVGLVSADGWRVPYSGSDCVVYHEGLGHTIGLPHPDPADDSVMCFAQYHYWINQTWITPSQKKKLGWPKGTEKVPPDFSKSHDLFSAFSALQDPIVPKVGEPVNLNFTWPVDAKVKSLKIQIQTDLKQPWKTVLTPVEVDPPSKREIGKFEQPTPVSYRVNATLQDGQTVEIRGYFQVKEGK